MGRVTPSAAPVPGTACIALQIAASSLQPELLEVFVLSEEDLSCWQVHMFVHNICSFPTMSCTYIADKECKITSMHFAFQHCFIAS